MALEFEGFGEDETFTITDIGANGRTKKAQPMNTVALDKLRDEDGFLPLGLTEVEAWENYTDDKLYEMDKLIRKWLRKTWCHRKSRGKMRTAVPLLFAYLYGRPPEPKDSQTCVMMHRILKYYCTRYTKSKSTIDYKEFTRVYWFSQYSNWNRRPYSLRLRIEEMEDGKDPFRKSWVDNRDKSKKFRRRHPGDVADDDGSGGEHGGSLPEGELPGDGEDGGGASGS